jgi:pimeloyl-ACP methyl ester carboxylesterase
VCAAAADPAVASSAAHAPTRTVRVHDHQIAYRALGPEGGVPLLLLNRFRGTMDHWDPALLAVLAAERRVLLFDQPGFARSEGQPPDSQAAFAANAAAFAQALGIAELDLLGFSMGGTVALQLLLDQPALVRRAVVAGSGPGHVPDLPQDPLVSSPAVWQVATKASNTDEDFLFLFFEPTATSQQAGRDYLARLRQRPDAFVRQVEAAAWQAQLAAALALQDPAASLLPRLGAVRQPVLVANGRHDTMVATYASYAMAQALPDATLVLYPDAGHGFLFQYPERFGGDVLRFLR